MAAAYNGPGLWGKAVVTFGIGSEDALILTD